MGSSLKEALAPKQRTPKGEKDGQFNGVKLVKSQIEELYTTLDIPLDTAGSAALDLMIAEITGEEVPEESKVSKDGSKFVGKKMSVKESENATVFNSHLALCQALGIPATTSGANTFRTVLERWLKAKGKI